MTAKILGFQIVDYVSGKTGKPVKGAIFNLAYAHPDFVGSNVKSEYIASNTALYSKLQPLTSDLVNRVAELEYVPDKIINGQATFKLADITIRK